MSWPGCETRNKWLATAPRAGGFCLRSLPALLHWRSRAWRHPSATPPVLPGGSDTNVGWTVGVGLEGVIAGNWTAKVEYLYADLGDTTCAAAACGVATNVDLQLNILRAGLNYRF